MCGASVPRPPPPTSTGTVLRRILLAAAQARAPHHVLEVASIHWQSSSRPTTTPAWSWWQCTAQSLTTAALCGAHASQTTHAPPAECTARNPAVCRPCCCGTVKQQSVATTPACRAHAKRNTSASRAAACRTVMGHHSATLAVANSTHTTLADCTNATHRNLPPTGHVRPARRSCRTPAQLPSTPRSQHSAGSCSAHGRAQLAAQAVPPVLERQALRRARRQIGRLCVHAAHHLIQAAQLPATAASTRTCMGGCPGRRLGPRAIVCARACVQAHRPSAAATVPAHAHPAARAARHTRSHPCVTCPGARSRWGTPLPAGRAAGQPGTAARCGATAPLATR